MLLRASFKTFHDHSRPQAQGATSREALQIRRRAEVQKVKNLQKSTKDDANSFRGMENSFHMGKWY